MVNTATQFFKTFAGLDRAYGVYTLAPVENLKPGEKAKGSAFTVAKPLTISLWEDHLLGISGLGVVPIRDDNSCRWGAIDVDEYNLDLDALEKKVTDLGLPAILCRTKSGGAHLYFFFSEDVPASLVQKKLKMFGAALGYPDIEVFPKQTELNGPKDTGNWINMPYFGGNTTNRYALQAGNTLSLKQFLKLAAGRSITEKELAELNPKVPEEPFFDGPPCLQHLAKVGFDDNLNHALFNVGVYYREKFPDDWEALVAAANERWMGPGTYQEVQGIIKSLNKKGYKYKCSDEPLSRHCQRGICSKRDYGVPDVKTTRSAAKNSRACILANIDRPVKCFLPPEGCNDEPIWEFKIHGRQLDVTCDMVMDQRKFNRAVLVQFQRLALPVTEEKWQVAVNELMSEAEYVVAPRDSGPEGQLWLHLEAFCTGKVQAKSREDLIMNRPYTEEGRTYFRSPEFLKYLDQQHYRGYSSKDIYTVLRRGGGKHGQFNIKGLNVQWWSVPEFNRQTEDFDHVSVDDGPPF